MQALCLTSSALVGAFASEACSVGDLDDLEELHDLDAPELVNLAQADAVRSCRVAELVRVNGDAKQKRTLATKTRCLIGHWLFACMLKKLPGFF